jgi:hypothetical protein
MATFTDCADNLTCATLSGSDGVLIGVALGAPNKITASVDSTVVRTTGTQTIAGNKTFSNNITCSNNIVLTNAGGIVFGTNAGGSGASVSNILSDYEEGTFQPFIYSGYDTGSIDYLAQEGYYTKIGKMVYFTVYIITENCNGNATNVAVGGFPFISQDITVNGLAFLQAYISDAQIYAYFANNNTYISFRSNLSAGITGITYGNDPTIAVVGYYRTAS